MMTTHLPRRSPSVRAAALVGALLLAGPVVGCSRDADTSATGADPSESVPSVGESPTDGVPGVEGGGSERGPDDASGSGSDGPDVPEGSEDGSTAVDPEEADPEAPDDGVPGSPDRRGRQGDVFDRVPGDAGRGCVEVDGQRDIRSGGFVGGSFEDAARKYGTARQGFGKLDVRLYFIPLHAAGAPDLTIATAGPAGAEADVRRVTEADADEWAFYDTVVRLPSEGRWEFRVSAGQDSGCFVATF